MMWDSVLNDLVDLFAGVYRDSGSAAVVVRKAGLAPENIDLSGKPKVMWLRILEEANLQGRVPDLVRVVAEEYPNLDIPALRSQSEASLAVKGAYMEVVADTVGSIGVLIAGIVTITTHWPYADVVVAVLVALWVLPRAIALARAALRILSESSPAHIDVEELRSALGAVDGVTDVHDLHVWTLSPGKDMCTAHLRSAADSARVLSDARAVLQARGLDHATVQIDCLDGTGQCEETF